MNKLLVRDTLSFAVIECGGCLVRILGGGYTGDDLAADQSITPTSKRTVEGLDVRVQEFDRAVDM